MIQLPWINILYHFGVATIFVVRMTQAIVNDGAHTKGRLGQIVICLRVLYRIVWKIVRPKGAWS